MNPEESQKTWHLLNTAPWVWPIDCNPFDIMYKVDLSDYDVYDRGTSGYTKFRAEQSSHTKQKKRQIRKTFAKHFSGNFNDWDYVSK